MIPDTMPQLKETFNKWLSESNDGGPLTIRDLVSHDEIDIELLEHLATFVWREARGYMPTAEFKLQKLDRLTEAL
jgi:hypothetical protein